MPGHHAGEKTRRVLELVRSQGVIRARDVIAMGVSSQYLAELTAHGLLRRVERGLYESADSSPSVYRSLAEVALKAPRGTICLLSALAYHGIGTQLPASVWIALPKGAKPPTNVPATLSVVWLTGRSLEEGAEVHPIDGIPVRIYSLAKTVADCWRFRNKVGTEVALEATAEALRKGAVAADDLYKFAKIDRVWEVMRPYLETLQR